MSKILIYGINYAPEQTGTGKYTAEMAEWLSGQGHDVTVITGMPHYPEWKISHDYKDKGFFTEKREGVKIKRVPHFVPSSDKVNGKNRILMELSFNFKALRYWLTALFQKKRFDVVIAITPPLELVIYPIIFSRLRRVPIIIHIQDLQVDAAFRLKLIKDTRINRILYKIENFLLRKSTYVSTITNAMLQRVIQKGVNRVNTFLLPNWSNIGFIKPSTRINSFRKSLLGEDGNRILLTYSGNVGEKQGLEIVLYAAKKLEIDSSIHFALIGEGAAKARLISLANELELQNVSFLPVQPLEMLPEVLSSADIHLVIQKNEAADLVMPSKLTNILAAGRPSIVTAMQNTELYEVIMVSNSGIVINPGDVDALIDAIKYLIDNPNIREEMGMNARKYAEIHLNKEVILSNFEKELSHIITSKCGKKGFEML